MHTWESDVSLEGLTYSNNPSILLAYLISINTSDMGEFCLYSLLKHAFNSADYMCHIIGLFVNNELEKIRKWSWPNLKPG